MVFEDNDVCFFVIVVSNETDLPDCIIIMPLAINVIFNLLISYYIHEIYNLRFVVSIIRLIRQCIAQRYSEAHVQQWQTVTDHSEGNDISLCMLHKYSN